MLSRRNFWKLIMRVCLAGLKIICLLIIVNFENFIRPIYILFGVLLHPIQCPIAFQLIYIKKLSVITFYLIHNHFLNKNTLKINCNYILFDSNYFPNENTSKIKCYWIPFDAQSLFNQYTSKIKCNYILFDSNYFPNENTSKIKCYYIPFDAQSLSNRHISKINRM